MSDIQIEITPQELKALPQDSYQLIDTRDDASIAYGMANGAIHIPQEAVVDRLTSEPELLKGRTAILYCARGILSMELASELNRRGIPSRSLTGGYNGWLLAHLAGDTPDESEEEKEDLLFLMDSIRKGNSEKTFFAPYCPDPFTMTNEAAALYDSCIPIEDISGPVVKKGRKLFGKKGGRNGKVR